MYPNVTAAHLTRVRTWKEPRCPPTQEWIHNLWCIQTMEYYSVIKNNAFKSVLMRRMNLEPILQSEVRATQILSITASIWDLEIRYWWNYLQGRSADTDRQNSGERRRGAQHRNANITMCASRQPGRVRCVTQTPLLCVAEANTTLQSNCSPIIVFSSVFFSIVQLWSLVIISYSTTVMFYEYCSTVITKRMILRHVLSMKFYKQYTNIFLNKLD